MKITAPWLSDHASQAVCAMLQDAGHQALFVGGCVRNAVIGARVNDLDIATDARPEKVMALAEGVGLRAVATGIEHGTITVISDDRPYEITTFRRDVATDGRRAVVAFSERIEDDARRRDFTMNALYAEPDGAVIDPLGGLPDLQAGRVRFIEDAHMRIQEDYLRILRFFRFHAWFGAADNGIDESGLAACAAHVEGLETLSAERVGQEMLKLLAAPDPSPAVASMVACGAMLRILPGAGLGSLPVLVHIEGLAGIDPDPIRRLAVLGGEGQADRLRLSRQQAARLSRLDEPVSPQEQAYRHGKDAGIDRLLIEAAGLERHVSATDLQRITDAAQKVFPLSAQDLMPGLSGAALGQTLKDAEARWIASGFALTKPDLMP